MLLLLQAQSKLDGVLSGIGGEEGEALEWELPSEEEEEAAAAGASDLRSTEEWKQYVAPPLHAPCVHQSRCVFDACAWQVCCNVWAVVH